MGTYILTLDNGKKYKVTTEDKPSIPESIARGSGQGITLGFQDELAGLISAPIEAGIEAVTNRGNLKVNTPSLGDRYTNIRNQERMSNLEAQKANPISYLGGQMAGISPSMFIPGTQSISGMAGLGAIQGIGSSEATNVGNMAKDTAIGAGIGAGAGLVGRGIGALASKVAIPAARRALAFTKGMMKNRSGVEQANKVGQTMIEKGVIKPLSSPEGMLNRVNEVLNTTGEKIGSVRSELQSAGQKAINPLEAATEIQKQLMPEYTQGAYAGSVKDVNEIIETVLEHLPTHGDRIDFEAGQKLLKILSKNSKFSMANSVNLSPEKAALYGRAYGIVSDMMDKATEEGLKFINKPQLMSEFIKNKELFNQTKSALMALESKYAGEASRNPVGLESVITMAGHGPIGLGVEALKRYGTTSAATLARPVAVGTARGIGVSALTGIPIINKPNKNITKGSGIPINQ